jgi:Domain of unknown function (DUF4410)
VTIDQGNATARMIIGFGAGGTKIRTPVQAYVVEPTGRRLLAEARREKLDRQLNGAAQRSASHRIVV